MVVTGTLEPSFSAAKVRLHIAVFHWLVCPPIGDVPLTVAAKKPFRHEMGLKCTELDMVQRLRPRTAKSTSVQLRQAQAAVQAQE